MEQKRDIQTLINLASVLAQYSRIHTVRNVSYAGQPSHAQAIWQTQKWLNMNCDVVDGEYRLKATPSPANAEQEGPWRVVTHHEAGVPESGCSGDNYITITDGKVSLYFDGGMDDDDEQKLCNLLNQLKIKLDYDHSAEFVASEMEKMYKEACDEIRRLREQVGLRWVNCSEVMPENKKWNYVFRQKNNIRSIKLVYLDYFPNISAFMQLPLEQIEWLCEYANPPVKEAGQSTKEVNMDFAKWVTEAGYSYDKLNGWLDEKEGEYSDKEMWNLYQQSLTNKQPG